MKVHEVWLPADNIDVKLDAALAAGNAGDVIMMSPDWKGLRSKWFEDLNPYIEKDQLDLEALLTQGLMGICRCGRKTRRHANNRFGFYDCL